MIPNKKSRLSAIHHSFTEKHSSSSRADTDRTKKRINLILTSQSRPLQTLQSRDASKSFSLGLESCWSQWYLLINSAKGARVSIRSRDFTIRKLFRDSSESVKFAQRTESTSPGVVIRTRLYCSHRILFSQLIAYQSFTSKIPRTFVAMASIIRQVCLLNFPYFYPRESVI